jgi:alkanesulfonate monooxygenase SsuD/methylene tetrahydromethanopterin reductase-like flavin-dependent oxidoreductase (luciferase family)
LANTVALAQLAERRGYHRFWVAEHHGDGATRAACNPPETSDDPWSQHLSGGPDRIRTMLDAMAAEAEADEVILHDLIADPADRRRSLELAAEAFELTPAAV